MSRLEELAVVRTKTACLLREAGMKELPAGMEGTIVHVHPCQPRMADMVMVEFENPFGDANEVFTLPETMLEVMVDATAVPIIEPVSVAYDATPVVAGMQFKYCCQKCGHRWHEILQEIGPSVCERCGEKNVQPYAAAALDDVLPLHTVSPLDLILDALNSALEADPAAISLLFGIRVPCNETLAEHPTVRVSKFERSGTTVGAIGLVNAIAHAVTGTVPDLTGYSPLCAQWDVKEARVLRFLRYPVCDRGMSPGSVFLQ